ncbi:venom acid phosphatase Acph-1 [Dendroctonus ponderosae]
MQYLMFVWFFLATSSCRAEDSDSLKLVHVLFRHGNRNPDQATLWEGSPFANESFYPEGFGQLTNAGKRTEYNLGVLLRDRYDEFLGDTWNSNLLDVRTTDYNRTKMSALLVLAGLWPPRGSNVWNDDLPWQPIPYNYYSSSEDTVLSTAVGNSTLAGYFDNSETSEYLASRYGEMMEILSENTGIAADDYYAAFLTTDGIKVLIQLGFPQKEWEHEVFPEPIKSFVVDYYYIVTNTTERRKVVSGPFIQKILTDSEAFINGTISPSSRKMFLYSAHDFNVGCLLLSLDAFALPESPPYGAAVLLELHEIDGVYGLKLFYVDYRKGSPHALSIPGCSHFCPFDQFYSLVEEILPD